MAKLSLSGKQALDSFIVCYSYLSHFDLPLTCPSVLQKETGETGNVPGFVYGITSLEEEIYFQGAGTRVVNDATSGCMTPDSVFWICSQTKLVVAVCNAHCCIKGQIHLSF
jgi:CubicO group peptidase (beta-lactamase class C family)